MSSGDFGFPEFSNSTTYEQAPNLSSFQVNLSNLPIQPNLRSVYPPVPQQQALDSYGRTVSRIGDKRKPEPSINIEEQSRRAAEEDKRRRNTAASARFRVKKKQREQALEKSAKDMTEKVTALEGRISQLETENKWLKNIVVEKNGGNDDFLSKLLDEFNNKHQSKLREAEEVSNLKAPTSPEEREAADSSG